ncbi:hypothetical protein [Rhodanobacter sp. B04]|uniref:hypothetical protein n=1 Tax=Rhodanobacter sp. B04 TaxID=1945860 RepID=UPI001115A13E|nr:hypothetical protein [Rhodanobacter sp. B04]
MPTFKANDTIYIPATLLPSTNPQVFEYAIVKTTVAQVQRAAGKGGNRVRVKLPPDGTPNPGVSNWIPVSKCSKHIGIAIIAIGDLSTEPMLIDPLYKSVLQFCRLMINDSDIEGIKLRSLDELKKWASTRINMFSHLIFIGHGDSDSIEFAVDGEKTSADIRKALQVKHSTKKVCISLCCKTGSPLFSEHFSKASFCGFLAAPQNSVAGSTASLFCQAFLQQNLGHAQTPGIAFKSALNSTPGDHQFSLWKRGAVQAC